MSAWKLTVRHGPEVSRQVFDDLDAALEVTRRQVEELSAEGPLQRVSMLRDFEPAAQVRARLEISGKGLIRPPTAGLDLRGDGSLVAFSGALTREELKPEDGESPYELVRRALEPRAS